MYCIYSIWLKSFKIKKGNEKIFKKNYHWEKLGKSNMKMNFFKKVAKIANKINAKSVTFSSCNYPSGKGIKFR